MIEDSFHVYQEGQFDDLWDEYLDWIGLASSRSVDVDSVDEWLDLRGDDISERAATVIREYVTEDHP